ncbi:MAG: hypothetical protein AAGC81_04290 [Pseudomonadota bacterium]
MADDQVLALILHRSPNADFLMRNSNQQTAPHLRLSETEVDAAWISEFPSELAQSVTSVRISTSSRYFLSGAIFLRVPDETREGKFTHGKLAFKLVAARSFFSRSRRYSVEHFVSSIMPRSIRRHYAGPFLKAVLLWLRSRGFEEVRFPIHSRRRRSAFEKVIRDFGFAYHLRNRIFFKIVVVDLRTADDHRSL